MAPPSAHTRIRAYRAGEEVAVFVVLTQRLAVFVDTLTTDADWDHVYGNAEFLSGGTLPAAWPPSNVRRTASTKSRSCPAFEK
ncbi:hypothetical protein [Deinococcus hopiensis]|uniref:hypothetical protein n=1 Tax=Deinococcus hopiensis TaxID=309885 RepID=UPI00111C52E4|nr:hypothetical protein [Deinococcus hopiensis]